MTRNVIKMSDSVIIFHQTLNVIIQKPHMAQRGAFAHENPLVLLSELEPEIETL